MESALHADGQVEDDVGYSGESFEQEVDEPPTQMDEQGISHADGQVEDTVGYSGESFEQDPEEPSTSTQMEQEDDYGQDSFEQDG